MRIPRPAMLAGVWVLLLCILPALLLALWPAAALGDVPNLDSHAGKLIIRDGGPVSAGLGAASATPKAAISIDSGRVALALVSVVGLIFLLRYIAKVIFPAGAVGPRGGAVRILSRCVLAPRQQVVLIQVGRRIVVAADCGSQLSSLCQITDADEVASLLGEIQRQKTSPISHPFTAWFSRAKQEFTDAEVEAVQSDASAENAEASETIGDESAARQEIRGLADKVRAMARQLGSVR